MLAPLAGLRALPLLPPDVSSVVVGPVELGELPGVVFDVFGPVDVVAGALLDGIAPLLDLLGGIAFERCVPMLPLAAPAPVVAGPVELGEVPGGVFEAFGPVDVVAGALGGVPGVAGCAVAKLAAASALSATPPTENHTGRRGGCDRFTRQPPTSCRITRMSASIRRDATALPLDMAAGTEFTTARGTEG